MLRGYQGDPSTTDLKPRNVLGLEASGAAVIPRPGPQPRGGPAGRGARGERGASAERGGRPPGGVAPAGAQAQWPPPACARSCCRTGVRRLIAAAPVPRLVLMQVAVAPGPSLGGQRRAAGSEDSLGAGWGPRAAGRPACARPMAQLPWEVDAWR